MLVLYAIIKMTRNKLSQFLIRNDRPESQLFEGSAPSIRVVKFKQADNVAVLIAPIIWISSI